MKTFNAIYVCPTPLLAFQKPEHTRGVFDAGKNSIALTSIVITPSTPSYMIQESGGGKMVLENGSGDMLLEH